MQDQEKYRALFIKLSRYDDEKALKSLFDIFYGKLVEIAKFFVEDQFAAQDIVSEVFIKLWKNRSNLADVKNVSSYLFVAVKRQAFNTLRDSKKRNVVSIDEYDALVHIEFENPEKILLSHEFVDILTAAVQELPSKCRLIYSLVKDDGMKYREVAETMDISIKTVEMHVGKALKRIKLAFEKYQK